MHQSNLKAIMLTERIFFENVHKQRSIFQQGCSLNDTIYSVENCVYGRLFELLTVKIKEMIPVLKKLLRVIDTGLGVTLL